MNRPVVLDGDVLQVSPMCIGAAIFSADGRRRRWLYRFLGQGAALPPKRVGMLMLNPSDAGAMDDDHTITRCLSFAWKAGGSSLEVANASDLIETDSKKMARPAASWNDGNSAHYVRHVLTCDEVIVAWGAAKWAGPVLAELLGDDWRPEKLWCLGTTKAGELRHPLYLRGDTPLVPWLAAARERAA